MTYCWVIVEPPWRRARAADVVVQRPGDADRVDAAVLVEVLVLGGEHRLLQHVGDLVEPHVGAVLLGAEGGDGVVGAAGLGDVGGAHERRLEQRLLGRQLDVEHDRRDAAGAGHDHQPDHEEAAPPAPQEAAIGARTSAARTRHRRGGRLRAVAFARLRAVGFWGCDVSGMQGRVAGRSQPTGEPTDGPRRSARQDAPALRTAAARAPVEVLHWRCRIAVRQHPRRDRDRDAFGQHVRRRGSPSRVAASSPTSANDVAGQRGDCVDQGPRLAGTDRPQARPAATPGRDSDHPEPHVAPDRRAGHDERRRRAVRQQRRASRTTRATARTPDAASAVVARGRCAASGAASITASGAEPRGDGRRSWVDHPGGAEHRLGAGDVLERGRAPAPGGGGQRGDDRDRRQRRHAPTASRTASTMTSPRDRTARTRAAAKAAVRSPTTLTSSAHPVPRRNVLARWFHEHDGHTSTT